MMGKSSLAACAEACVGKTVPASGKPVLGFAYDSSGPYCFFAKRIRLMTVHIMIMTHMIATTLFHTKKLTMESVS